MEKLMDNNMTDEEKERLEDEEFARTGSCSFKMDIDITITENDMLQDLVKKTEGKNIPANDITGHNRN